MVILQRNFNICKLLSEIDKFKSKSWKSISDLSEFSTWFEISILISINILLNILNLLKMNIFMKSCKFPSSLKEDQLPFIFCKLQLWHCVVAFLNYCLFCNFIKLISWNVDSLQLHLINSSISNVL